MRKTFCAVLSIAAMTLAAPMVTKAESTWEYSVQASAIVQSAPAQITLTWPQDTYSMPSSYTVYRRAPGATSWGSGTVLPGNSTTFVDNNVTVGTPYEYQIVKQAAGYRGFGYVYAGIGVPLTENRGRLLLVVDNTHAASLATELGRLQQDLVGDGWTVTRLNVNRNDTAANVKNVIRAQYNADPSNVKAVLLFGRVPVPYSGNIVPDGHAPEHQGAWPSDAYYGDMDGSWTDNTVNVTGASDPRNRNVPGDGKFDQSYIPSPLELMVGRVDLSNLPGRKTWGGPPTFPSEVELLRNYLNKNHDFRHKKFDLPRRAIVGDFFGTRNGEAFAASGWRNFAPLVGADNVTHTPTKGTWIPTLRDNAFLWAYGCGAGSYTSIAGLGNTGIYQDGVTTELVENDIQAVFTMLFGSWLGDWDSEDNIQRAALATSHGLTASWSGRPHWFLHHMGLGETIGFGTRLTQNNDRNGSYQNEVNSAAGMIHIALMGDPTLRLHPVAPPTQLRNTAAGSGVSLNWTPSADTVVGYHVYRASSTNGPFTRVTSSLLTDTSYTDASAGAANHIYMVRAVKLETTPSGSYFNASQGAFVTATGTSTSQPESNTDTTTTAPTPTNTQPAATVTGTIWFDDALPAGAVPGADGGAAWNWISSNPAPVSGSRAHQSSLSAGLHQVFFTGATATMNVAAGDRLFAYVYLDPANPPSQIMLQWNDGSWEHRAYWGANSINYGVNGTASRRYMGPLPAAGQWVRLEVPASQVNLEGSTVRGMAFSLFGGRATWDAPGKASQSDTTTPTTPPPTNTNTAPSTVVTWVDDALPTGAVPAGEGGDTWNWITSNPAPQSGTRAHQSALASGLHQHFFTGATATMTVNAGETLFAHVYLDPSNPPSQVMLQWNDGSWEHRAYWGANSINYGVNGTASRRYMGPLPAAGQWVRLEVPASQVNLQGSTVRGMAFTLFGGRAAWDNSGKFSGTFPTTPPTPTNPPSTETNSPPSSVNTNTPLPSALPNRVSWVDDALPSGAVPAAEGGDTWTWITSNPTPISGARAHPSAIASGLHQHFFTGASSRLSVGANDTLYAYVYLDPANVPSQVMLQWNDGSWEHRAYWGANSINYGVNGTASRRYMGPLPPAGQWVLLQVPASQVNLAGSTVSGMAFSLFGGRATWDDAGKFTGTVTNTPPPNTDTNTPPNTDTNTPPNTSTNTPPATTNTAPTNLIAWVDDALPTGAVPAAEGGDSWNWITSNPAPFSGTRAHQSAIASGLHQHFFTGASSRMTVNAGETLVSHVYLDPSNPPSQVMLQWNDGSWEHRAYWGANSISYGVNGTASRRYMGPLPAVGQWVRLEVPASQVNLEGSTVSGMAFSLFGGRAAWDLSGKLTASGTTNPPADGGGTTNPPSDGGSTNAPPADGGSTNAPPADGGSTNAPPADGGITNTPPPTVTNTPPSHITNGASTTVSVVNYALAELPKAGDNGLNVLTPTLLELKLINTKNPDPARVTQWDLVSNGTFSAPPLSAFAVTANGQPVAVQSVGFKRRPLYAPLAARDLRIDNSLYLQLAAPISDNQTIEVRNPNGSLWPSTMQFVAQVDPLRYSPAIHVNQEGYMPGYAKKAMVGYYLGNMGEMNFPHSAGFRLVDANTGAQVFQGTLSQRADVGYTLNPLPYQRVYEADFTGFNTPGEYRLVVPGMGASLPFLVHDGIAMSFARTYALGLYHQRCGHPNSLPFTRHTHDACHTATVDVPSPQSSFSYTWNVIASESANLNPAQTAPRLQSESTQLFPFVTKGKINVSGGHHDAGDYSKYTLNSAPLIHNLVFAADSLAGVGDLDNLGIPESGDGISDLLQEAKIEADFLAKMQDADGGFYFLVYPRDRRYEQDRLPDKGDPQLVWPKTTAATAASVAALAQIASSPRFKQAYPEAAAMYLQKAQLGWQFLMNAINTHGRQGSYQKITHYGNDFTHEDELAWAACEMYLATGNQTYHQFLMSSFDPANPATRRWGWWRMCQSYGNAIRSYAFAARSGRLPANQLNATYLAKCEAEIIACGNDTLRWSNQGAYGSSFSEEAKRYMSAGWYFSGVQAFDIAVAYQLQQRPEYLTAIVANMNYEGGGNPVNVTYLTGLGWKRQREIVHLYAQNDHRILPPSGIPLGNIQASFAYLDPYKTELNALVFPADASSGAAYPLYDRWGDSFNVTTEFVHTDQTRALAAYAFLAARSSLKSQSWKPGAAQIVAPATTVPVGQPVTVSLQVPGMDLSGARVVWEARDQEPAYGRTFTFSPKNTGAQWIEAEAHWPDGRRVSARGTLNANSSNVVWVDDALPAGAVAGADGGDSWNWITSNPTPFSGTRAHQSALASGAHQHYFDNATATMAVGTGDVMYAYIYLDPANPPTQVMLQWNNGNWEHRAYWGANSLSYGINGTDSRRYVGPLPPVGQWVRLEVPASLVGLEGSVVKGMAFTLFNGRATWDASGRTSPSGGQASLSVPNVRLQMTGNGPTLTWPSTPERAYHVAYKNALNESVWNYVADRITATGNTTSWLDASANGVPERYYFVAQLD